MKNIILFCAYLVAYPFFAMGETSSFLIKGEWYRDKLQIIMEELKVPPKLTDSRCPELEEFQRSFFAVKGSHTWRPLEATVHENVKDLPAVVYGKKALEYKLFSEKSRSSVAVCLIWTKNVEYAKDYLLEDILRLYSGWKGVSKYYEPLRIGDYGLINRAGTHSSNKLVFFRGNVFVRILAEDDTAAFQEEMIKIARELDALLCGKAEFLPDDAAELVEIRKAWERELERRKQESLEAYLKSQQEWQARERKRKAEELKTLSLDPTHQRETYKNLETRFELLKKHLKPRRVPAGTRDPDAWEKNSPPRAAFPRERATRMRGKSFH